MAVGGVAFLVIPKCRPNGASTQDAPGTHFERKTVDSCFYQWLNEVAASLIASTHTLTTGEIF